MTTAPAATEWGSAGNWFGTTLGSTCWLAISSVVLLAHGERTIALIVAACYLLPAAVSLRAWTRRDRATPYGALEAWFLIAWLASMVAVAVVHATGTQAMINLPEEQIWSMWVALLLGGGLMWGAIRRWQRRGSSGVSGGLFDVLASWM